MFSIKSGVINLAKLRIGDSVSKHLPLWRYMSLDKLIHMLESESLFFAPLQSYKDSDPFEGYLPKKAFQALSGIFQPEYKELEAVYEQLEERQEKIKAQGFSSAKGEVNLNQLRKNLNYGSTFLKNSYNKIVKGINVNCWHNNQSESEAMWKLYSENGKSIAVKTSVGAMAKSIESIEQDLLVQIGAVKYLDFFDLNISPKDCVVDGQLSPLLKRIAFSHENEVRLFIVPKVNAKNIDKFEPQENFVKINIEKLIEKIYISPFAGEPFISSTFTICKKYGIASELVHESTLLKGHQELLDTISDW